MIEVKLLAAYGDDNTVADAALASSGKELNHEEKCILIDKLISQGHDSCLEHIVYRFSVKAPLYIINQMTRHRIGVSYNQASRRYKYPFKEYYKLPDDVRNQMTPEDASAYEKICTYSLWFYEHCRAKYNKRVVEVASGVLPVAMISSLTETINLRALLHFLDLRLDKHAQPEIRIVAQKMLEAIESDGKTAIIFKSLKAHGRIKQNDSSQV